MTFPDILTKIRNVTSNTWRRFTTRIGLGNGTALPDQVNTTEVSITEVTTIESVSQYNKTNMLFPVPSVTDETDRGQLYWGVWLAMVVCCALAMVLAWLVLRRRRRFCHTAGHQLPSSTGLKVRPAIKPRLHITPDVIPQRSTATKSTSIKPDPSQPEIIELKPYLLPYLSGRNEKMNEGNHRSDNVSENSNTLAVPDRDQSGQRNIQLRPPMPHPECLNNALNAVRENSLYANLANENNIYAVPRLRTHEEMLTSSNREFVHVYELPPDYVSSQVTLAPSTQSTRESFRHWFRRKFL